MASLQSRESKRCCLLYPNRAASRDRCATTHRCTLAVFPRVWIGTKALKFRNEDDGRGLQTLQTSRATSLDEATPCF